LGHILLVGTFLVVATIVFHISLLLFLAHRLIRLTRKLETFGSAFNFIVLTSFSLIFIVAIHTAEIWFWAGIYYYLGEFALFEQALYFSAVTATTLGYGDIVLSPQWQLLSTFEAMAGLLLFGASTAFLIAMMRKMFGVFIDE